MSSLSDLVDVLDVERIEMNLFRGRVQPTGRSRVFGGLVVAQALTATARTVPDRAPHSLHAYFVLPADPAVPILYDVERVRDGRSFTTRRCVAIQAGRPIFDLFASFQLDEPGGLEHQAPMPVVPAPEDLPTPAELAAALGARMPDGVRAWFSGERALELRPCDSRRFDPTKTPEPVQRFWVRATGALPDDPAVHRAVLSYLSDLTLIDVALAAHGRTLFEPAFSAASLDHALWFHRPFRADDWLLYSQDSPNMAGNRGLARGLIHDRNGRLVASVVQEGLIRLRQPPPTAA